MSGGGCGGFESEVGRKNGEPNGEVVFDVGDGSLSVVPGLVRYTGEESCCDFSADLAQIEGGRKV